MSSDKVLYQRLKCTTIPGRDVLLELPSTGGWSENRFEVFAYLGLTSWTFFLPFLSGGSTHNLRVIAQIEIILKIWEVLSLYQNKSFPVRRFQRVFSM